MRKIVFLILIATLACCKPGNQGVRPLDSTDIMLRTTPVKDQGSTSACWIYAMLACIETDRIEQYGDSIGLSAEWLLRSLHEEQRLRHRLMHGHEYVTQRGMAVDALRLMRHYGIIPDKIRPGRSGGFYLFSAHYTPHEFARSVYQKGDWMWFASSKHHPYGEEFAVETRDNYHFNEFINVPMDSLAQLTVRSLTMRHPVAWESERHAVAIVGMKRSADGTPLFIYKNSWGEDWGHKGFGTMTLKQFHEETLAIGVRNNVPQIP